MSRIEVIDFDGELVEFCDVLPGRTFADTAMGCWPDGWAGMTPFIYDSDGVEVNEARAVTALIGPDETWTIQLIPQAEVAISTWILMAVSVATLVLLRPQIPRVNNASYEWDDSDRPQFFSGQQNQVQPGRRVPDAFGNIRVYPDLLSAPAIDYEGNNQRIREMYVVSRGRFEAEQEFFFDDPLENQVNAEIRYYYPGEQWPMDFPLMRTNPSVGSIELQAFNETVSSGENMTISGNSIYVDIEGFWDEFIDDFGTRFRMDGVKTGNHGPHTVTGVSNDGKTLFVKPSFPKGETIIAGNANFRSLTKIYGGDNPTTLNITKWETKRSGGSGGSDNPVWEPITRWVESNQKISSGFPSPFTLIWRDRSDQKTKSAYRHSNGYISVNGDKEPPEGVVWVVKQASAQGGVNPDLPGIGYASSIFQVPGTVTEIWLDFEAPQGLYRQSSGESPTARKVKVEVAYRPVDPTGTLPPDQGWETVEYAFSGKTRTPLRFTRKIEVKSGEYEIYCRRITDFLPDTDSRVVVDAIQWIGLHGRQDNSSLEGDILNCTLADVTLDNRALQQTSANRRFNIVGTRQLFNYQTGQWELTRRMCDAIMHTLVEMGNVSRTLIDEQSLYDIQADLDAQGDFDGEFSGLVDQTMTLEDQLQLIAGVSRTIVYRRGATFYFRRLKAGETASTLINARNKIEPEIRNLSFSQANDPDAVILRFQNRVNGFKEDTVQYPPDVTPINAEEQTILGLCDPISVARMAQYNWNKRKYERDTIQIQMMEEGAMLAPGDVIAVTDHLLENKPIEGEIVGSAGTTYTFDQEIPAGTYAMRVRDKYGDLAAAVTVNIGAGGTVIDIPELGNIEMPDMGATTGLLYSFSEVQYDNKDLWHVLRVMPSREGNVTLEAMYYTDETYAGDTETNVTRSPKSIDRYDELRNA